MERYNLVALLCELLRGYSLAESPHVRKLLVNNALTAAIAQYLMPDARRAVDQIRAKVGVLVEHPTDEIVPRMVQFDEIWREAVELCRELIEEDDYLIIRDRFRAAMVTANPETWRIAFPDYEPKTS